MKLDVNLIGKACLFLRFEVLKLVSRYLWDKGLRLNDEYHEIKSCVYHLKLGT